LRACDPSPHWNVDSELHNALQLLVFEDKLLPAWIEHFGAGKYFAFISGTAHHLHFITFLAASSLALACTAKFALDKFALDTSALRTLFVRCTPKLPG